MALSLNPLPLQSMLLTCALAGFIGVGGAGCHETGAAVAPEVPRLPWPAAPVPCDREGFVAVWERATWEPSTGGEEQTAYFRYEARNSLQEPFDEILVESYMGTLYEGPDRPGRYVLDGTNYADCGLCIRIRTGCYGTWCTNTYFAGQGVVDIDAIGPVGDRFEASMRAIGLREADIEPQSLVSTVTEESPGWCLPEFEIDVPVKEGGAQERCSSLGTGTTLGEGIGNFTLRNCAGEPMDLHDACDEDRAVWIVATAGWCTACSAWLPQVLQTWAQRANDGIRVLVVLGENSAGGEPTQEYCSAYAQAHGIPEEHVYIDHGVISGWQSLFSHISPYLSGGFLTLPWNGLLDARNMEYVWSDAASTDSIDQALDDLLGK